MADLAINYKEAIENIQKLERAMQTLKNKEAELIKKRNDGSISLGAYLKSTKELRQEIVANEKSIKTLNQEMQNNQNRQAELEANVTRLQKVLKVLNDEYNSLSRADKDSAVGERLLENIMRFEEEMGQAKNAANQFVETVGDYSSVVSSVEERVSELNRILDEMSRNGQAGSEEFETLATSARELEGTLASLNEEANSNEPIRYDKLNESVKLLTTSYDEFKKVTETLGIEHQELDRAIALISRGMSILNTVTEVRNGLLRNSAVMEGVATIQAKARAVAIELGTKATSGNIIVSKAAAAAQWLFNAAVSANPIVLFVSLITSAVAAAWGLVKVFDLFSSSSKKREEALRQEGEAMEANIKRDERYLEQMKVRGDSEQKILNTSISLYKKQKDAAMDYLEKVGEQFAKDSEDYKNAMDKKVEAEARYRKSLDDGLNSLLKIQAQAQETSLKDSMTEAEYATHQATKAFEEQKKTLDILKESGEITSEKYNELFNSMENISKKAIDGANGKQKKEEDERYAASQKKRQEAAAAAMKAEEDAIRAGEDAIISLIKEGTERQRMETNLAYEREVSALQDRLNNEANLTENAKNEIHKKIQILELKRVQDLQKISDEAIAKDIAKETERLKKELEKMEAGSDEKLKIRQGILEKEKEAELQALGDAEEQKRELFDKYKLLSEGVTDDAKLQALKDAQAEELALIEEGEQKKLEIEEQYRQEGEALKESHRQEVLQTATEKLREEFEQRIEAAEEINEEELGLELERLATQLETLQQLEEESDEEFAKRKLEAQNVYLSKKSELDDKALLIEKAKQQAMSEITTGLGDMMETLGERNKAFAIASKVMALGEIAVNTGRAISLGVANAQKMPFPGNLAAVITTVATVMANISTAIKTVKSAKFATGGLVEGPGSESSDSIPARLSNGESVITARATQMFSPMLSTFNMLGGGVPINTAGSSNAVMGEEMLAKAVAKGVMMMPQPVVAVQEINAVSKTVSVVQTMGTIALE